MQGFILETLLVSGWKRGGEVYWTLADAQAVGSRLIKRKLARKVRILPAEIQLNPVAEVPAAQPAPPAATPAGEGGAA
jgi:hypothetical protein